MLRRCSANGNDARAVLGSLPLRDAFGAPSTPYAAGAAQMQSTRTPVRRETKLGHSSFALRSLSELTITLTELRLIAALAHIGETIPNAARGTLIAL